MSAVVVNPSRVRDLDGLRRQCQRIAAGYGWAPPRILLTSKADAGAGVALSAVEAGAQLIVCVGGDGTVRDCAQSLAGTSVPLAIVPTGTANLTARAVGVPAGMEAALATGFGGEDARIDVATADGAVFTAMAGMGLDAAVVAATPDAARRLAGWPAYAGSAVSQLLRRPVTFTVRLDGGEPLTRRARSVTVGNSGALPGGFVVLPGACVDDGLLDVLILAPSGLAGWADVGLRVAVGSLGEGRQLERHQAGTVEIRADAELPRQIDGEIIASGRSLTVAVRPGALLVRVPPVSQPRCGSQAG
ncbi:MAG TPA: diacylglycerol kinase family protein [Streptosporangiaceae bacterium]|nr:diacylglycerol kinase family protein [Streptosporangiaceae bacterium]